MAAVNSGDVSQAEKWLECQIDKGMFSDEMAVTYPASGAAQKSVFVSATAVRGMAGQRGKVKVRVIRLDGSFMAILPSSTQDIVSVSEQDVSEG